MKVLVVDDNRAILATTLQYLQLHGFDALGVDSAEEALPVCQNSSFDVVVTDYLMPGKDGLELADAILSLSPRPKLILTTGLPLSSEREIQASRHFDAVLVKPFRLDKLACAISLPDKSIR